MAKLTAKAVLIWSIYPPFLAEHNRGHHTSGCHRRRPCNRTERAVCVRLFGSSHWLAAFEAHFGSGTRETEIPVASPRENDVLRGCLSAGFTLCVMAMVFGGWAAGAFLWASVFGILLLETVNYPSSIMDFGGNDWVTAHTSELQHTWTSNHVLSRVLLLDLIEACRPSYSCRPVLREPPASRDESGASDRGISALFSWRSFRPYFWALWTDHSTTSIRK